MPSGGRAVAAFCLLSWYVIAVGVGAQQQDPNDGWKIPAGAADEKNPLAVNETLLAGGRKIFVSKCVRCHGPKGEGDGEDADMDLKKDMDLTRADRAAANPDGVVFFRVWNGRQEPRMPSFEDQLSKEQVWAVVAFVQTLRKR